MPEAMPKREEVRERMLEIIWVLCWTDSATMGWMARSRSWEAIGGWGFRCLVEVMLGDWAGGFAGVLGLVDLVGRLMVKLAELS